MHFPGFKSRLSPGLIFIFCFLFPAKFFSQGCSDGGVCSVGSLGLLEFRYVTLPSDKTTLKKIVEEDTYTEIKTNKNKPDSLIFTPKKDSTKKVTPKDTFIVRTVDTLLPVPPLGDEMPLLMPRYPRYQVQLGVHYGQGERNVSIVTPQLELTAQLVKDKLFGQVKVPYTFISGNLAKVSGPGDPTLSLSYIARNKSRSNLLFTAGVKIPANNGNISRDGLPLPMPYQTSLGSTDILLGAKYTYRKWDITLGYQHSFNANENQYLHRSLVSEDSVAYNSYFESNKMKRADDGIFRINRNFKFKKFSVHTGMLFIFHLDEDEYTNAKGERVKATGSEGLTLNLNFATVIPVSKKIDFTLIAAGPVVNRKYRTDGLTRHFVLAGGFRYNIF